MDENKATQEQLDFEKELSELTNDSTAIYHGEKEYSLTLHYRGITIPITVKKDDFINIWDECVYLNGSLICTVILSGTKKEKEDGNTIQP